MNRITQSLGWLTATLILLTAADARAQCSTHMLVSLDEERQSFNVTVRTQDVHCLASGRIDYLSDPPGAVVFERESDESRHWCFGLYAVDDIYQNRILAVNMPPGMPFQLLANTTYDDPWYPPQLKEEMVWVNPANGRLEILRPQPCLDNVPLEIGHGSFCFVVCHKVYRIRLLTGPGEGQPIIRVSPGCPPGGACPAFPCVPGNPWDYIHFVYFENGSWWLYFEYSNVLNEPVCYCVTWHRSLPEAVAARELAAWNDVTQTLEVATWMDGVCPAGYRMEVFSYPPGALIPEPNAEHCADVSEAKMEYKIPANAGGFAAGDTFQLVAYIDYDTICPTNPPDFGADLLIETVRALPGGGLERVSVGDCQSGGGVLVPTSMVYGQAECFIVCHDHYYVHLVTPPNATPMVTITPGCDPPCFSPAPCVPGYPWDYLSHVERWGNEYYLHFEYSNEQREPVCYCVHYNNLVFHSDEMFRLAALDEASQTLDVSLWMTGSGTMSGTMEIRESPTGLLIGPYNHIIPPTPEGVMIRESPTLSAGTLPPGTSGFFDIFLEMMVGGEPRQEHIIESFIVDSDGLLRRWDPVQPCIDNVPPTMDPGQSACFLVCHRVYDILMNTPPGAGEPIVSVVEGCHGQPNPECNMAPFCEPGMPHDYCYRLYRDPLGLWHMEFEYSNPIIEPVCYCVTYEGNLPDCETHELLALDEQMQTVDVSVCVTPRLPNPPEPCVANGHVTLSSNPPGAIFIVHPGQLDFTGVGMEWWTAEVAVEPGEFVPGETFEIVADIDYTDPPFHDRQLVEMVRVTPTFPPRLVIVDYGGECTGDVVPQVMEMNTTECFLVCHRVYHVSLGWFNPFVPPVVTVTPGCFGPPQDPCPPDIACVPGGPFDYRHALRWMGEMWELEFEYSNAGIEPVCYCVTVVSPLPPCEPHQVVVLDDFMQTLDITFWITSPTGIPCTASGFINVFSAPPGAYIGPYIGQFSVSDTERVTLQVPVSSGQFPPGSNFELVVAFEFVDPPYPGYSVSEPVLVTSTGSLEDTNLGIECSGGSVPREMGFGSFNCFTVCHGTYYVQLNAADDQIPQVHVWPGCDSLCWSPQPCTPGAPDAYTVSVEKIGSQWYLIFQYGGAVQPVCYCVHYWGVLIMPPHPLVLSSVNETVLPARDPGTLNVSLRSTSPFNPISGHMSIRSHPPGAMIGPYVESFFDIFTEFYTQEVSIGPGAFLPGQTFQLITEVVVDQPVPARNLYNEWAIVGPMGDLRVWDQVTPCTGDIVPQVMNAGDSQCFVVCHGVYRVLLTTPPGAGQPILDILPGCEHPHCQPAPICDPGDPRDYIYRLIPGDPDWILEFEYSNEFIQPVCYCVTYVGNLPDHCVTHELAALDELYQTFDVSTMVRGDGADICVANGWITAFSNPPGAEINPGSILFENVQEDWHTVEFAVGPGTFLPGSVFQLVARVDYVDPPYPDRWLIETVRVVAGDPVRLVIEDTGGECTGDHVPEFMFPGQSACFEVCHRVYHVSLAWPYPMVPQVVITPGCYGPEVDDCPPDPDCLPGGFFDYVAQVRFDEGMWILDFEYSNPDREPVCYCVTLLAPPCLPPDSLVIFYEFSEVSLPQLHFYWHAPQFGHYRIFSTPMPNHSTIPPSPEWTEETMVVGGPGQLHWSRPYVPEPVAREYRNFVIICECGPWFGLRK